MVPLTPYPAVAAGQVGVGRRVSALAEDVGYGSERGFCHQPALMLLAVCSANSLSGGVNPAWMFFHCPRYNDVLTLLWILPRVDAATLFFPWEKTVCSDLF